MPKARKKRKSTHRKAPERNSKNTRQTILEAATQEFARKGFGSARIEGIVARAKCNIRMIYYHFGNKEKLYSAVLEAAYQDIRDQEQFLHLEEQDPLEGMLKLLEFTFHHFANNPDFESLMLNENLMRGRFVLKSRTITEMASPLRHAINHLLRKGEEAGVFRKGLDPAQIYVTIAALSRFHLENAYTLSALFETDLTSDKWRAARLEHAREVLRAYLTRQPD